MGHRKGPKYYRLAIMSACWLLCLSAKSEPTQPDILPSGLDLLYGERVVLQKNGEPLITIGLINNVKTITFSAENGPLLLDWYQNGEYRQVEIPPETLVETRLLSSVPAVISYFVALRLSELSPAKREAIKAKWPNLFTLEAGAIWASRDLTVDTRKNELVIKADSLVAANALAVEVEKISALKHPIIKRLARLPFGELALTTKPFASPLGQATSYVRLTPAKGGQIILHHNAGKTGAEEEKEGERERYSWEIYLVVNATGQLAAVNVLGLETLLKGLVPAEIFPQAPIEALKAQAIAARSNIIAELATRHFLDPFHICNLEHCQVYGGINRERAETDRAINETRGMILVHEGQLVNALYSSTCGGHSEANWAAWPQTPQPYLSAQPDLNGSPAQALNGDLSSETRAKEFIMSDPPAFCRPEKFKKGANNRYRWQRSFKASELDELVRAHYPELGHIRQINVLQRGPGGRVMELELVGATKRRTVGPELAIRRLFGNLKSAFFVLASEHTNGAVSEWTFMGAGWGHGVGLCQTGAIGRAKTGATFMDILGHYYSGATVTKLY